MRKIFLEDLPHKKRSIDWNSCEGKEVRFIYESLSGTFKIIKTDINLRKAYTDYNGYQSSIYFSGLLDSNLSGILNVKRKHNLIFKYNVGDIVRNVEILDKNIDQERRKTSSTHYKKYKYLCHICKNIDWCSEESLNGCKYICNVCSHQKVLEGYNDIPTVAPWMIPYFQGGYDEAKQYSVGSHSELNFICPDCGEVRNKKIPVKILYRKKSIGCPCKDGHSYPNKFMTSVLKQLHVDFETEYSPQWISPRRYDFYIPSKSLIIEMDGNLGHGNTAFGKDRFDEKELLRCVQIDKYKDIEAKKHGFKIVRIDCRVSDMKYISENILKSKIFNSDELERIDFEQCNEYAIGNVVKMVCNSYEVDNIKDTKKLSKMYKIARTTIINYLHQGSSYGWCSYDSNKNIVENGIRNGKKNGINVVVKKNNMSLKKYNSISECARKSVEDFDIKFDIKGINACLKGNREEYKGYVFEKVG